MLADLFNDPSNENSSSSNYSSSYNNRLAPPGKRKETNLCGIVNQGATCYLNTLLQTLFLTKEFRENLFSLTADELGITQNKNGQQSKQRVILVELQRLFGQLLLSDQEACSTNKLTDSFGWTNNEELQQHDVQELNRILFSAIEQSLVNTKQAKLIQELYKGTYINKIRCLTCLNVIEREEDFLDLPITVQGSPNLLTSLSNSFVIRENLNGNNQYKCEKCNNQYRDAEKYCQLKTLPPILTLSLLRFTYDLTTYQRIKETGRFEFPQEIDLKEFMEDSIKSAIKDDYTKYELYSVLIHSGSAYGGHYHCYIKDLDNLGNWVLANQANNQQEIKPKENVNDVEKSNENLSKEICLICDDDEDENSRSNVELVNLDYLKYDKPLELLKAFIYNKMKYDELKIETLCTELTKVTGMSWNKRFKNKYGPIEKFLRKYDDTFEITQDGKYVKLKVHDRINIVSSGSYNSNELIEMCLKEVDQPKEELLKDEEIQKKDFRLSDEDLIELDAEHHWYNFNDSRITPIFSSTISKQFEGKESAYMLFYRKKVTSCETKLKLPNWLVDEINKENLNLKQKREEYEDSLNTVRIECYLEQDFYLEQNILNLKYENENKKLSLSIDKRNTTVNDLQEILVKYCTEQDDSFKSDHLREMQNRKETCLEMLFDERPSYWLLVQRVDTSTTGRFNYFVKSTLNEKANENLFKLISENNFVLVFSKHADTWPIGDEFEPIRIVLKFFDKQFQIKEISYTFTKSTLIKQVKEELGSFLVNEQTNYELGLSNEELNALSADSFTFNLIKFKPTSIISKSESQDEKILLESCKYDQKSLKDLSVKNGDFITVESEANIDQLFSPNKSVKSQATTQINYSNRMIKLNIINCLLSQDELRSGNLQTNELYVEECDIIKNVRVMALSSFDATNSSIGDSHLRFLNEDKNLNDEMIMSNLLNSLSLHETQSTKSEQFSFTVPCLHDDSILGEVLEPVFKASNLSKDSEQKFVFLLCPGKAPCKSNNEIMVKCYSEKSDSFVEILVELNKLTVQDLTDQLIEKMKFPSCDSKDEESYYLKKLDWFGDVESVLNNVNLLCSDVNLKHNQSLLITKGKLIPPNHLKLTAWIPASFVINSNNSSDNEPDQVILNDLIENKYKSFKLLDELIVSNDTKLEDLKLMIQSLLLDRNDLCSFNNIRLRLLKKQLTGDFKLDQEVKFQMKKPLIEWHKPLKQLHLNQESDLGVELLDEEEDNLNQGIMILDCVRFELKTRLCSRRSFKQIFWNINNGATLSSLKESIIKAYSDELQTSDMFRMYIAKRLNGKCQWLLLKDPAQNERVVVDTNKNSNRNKKKKSSNTQQALHANKSNLKQAPYNLDDGDLIAFIIPDQSSEPTPGWAISAQDFMSTEDLQYANKVNMTGAEINRLRKEKKLNSENENKSNRSQRRAEVGIKIKIDDFSQE